VPLFSSRRERRLWIATLLVLIAIYATLGLAPRLAGLLRQSGLIGISFTLGLVLTAVAILLHGLRRRAGKTEVFVWVGIAAAYLLLFARIQLPEERSHLIEYSLVAVLIFEALRERKQQGRHVPLPALLALLISSLLGLVDEGIQALLPNRVFDPLDLLFNFLAALMAITASSALSWARNFRRKPPAT